MTAATFRNDMTVELVQSVGGDESILAAMMVSTKASDSLDMLAKDPEASYGRLNFLMANRHGTPFEHASMTFLVEAPIFVYREWHRHRVGWCLAGDTEVWCETISEGCGRTLRKKPIAWLYDNWHNGVKDSLGRVRHLESCRGFTVRTLDELTGRFILSKVIDIYENGVKPLLELTTDHGETIKATGNHQVWTPEGWTKLGDLKTGDLIGRNGKVAVRPGGHVPPSLRRGIGVWSSMQRNNLIKPYDSCYVCSKTFPRDGLVLDHVVPVVSDLIQALDPNNLAPCCERCHRVKTNAEQVLANRGQTVGVQWTTVATIRSIGSEMTYDLELEGPNRGFVANGLVVHNSYNEESGRYTQLKPVFYIPAPERNLVQKGKPGHYDYVPGTVVQHQDLIGRMIDQYDAAYKTYEENLAAGIAKEVARMVLPVGIFSSMYATCNPRSLMAFLSLRTKDEESMFPSYPQREIEMCAEKLEAAFAQQFPLTHRAFCENGRVAP